MSEPRELMQRMIDKDTWLSRTVALLLFPVELIAIPFFSWTRIGYLLFGEIGWYGATSTYVVLCFACFAGESVDDKRLLFGIALSIILVCALIIVFLW